MKKIIIITWACLVSGLLSFAQHDEYNELVWSDEFDYTGPPDSSRWVLELGDGCPEMCGWGNNEVQEYTNDTKNARVEDGLLIIEAIKNNGRWTSAKLTSQGKKPVKYGKIEFRAKLPGGAGTWPALWMLGEDIETVGWPACGEIDVMEHVGKEPGQVHGSLHTPSSFGATQNTGEVAIPDFDKEFHVYSALWTPEKITFSVDGKEYYTYKPSPKNDANWPFDDEFYLIMNVAMGGNWGSDPRYETEGLKNGIEPGLTSAKMEVDYVRVYQVPGMSKK